MRGFRGQYPGHPVRSLWAAGLALLSVAGAAPQARADDPLTVAAFTIPGLLEENGGGLYAGMLADVARRTGIRIRLDVLPIARARASYRQGQYDCLLPLDPGVEDDYAGHLQSVPLAEARAYLFTRPGTPPLRGLGEVDGRRVGAELGVPYPAPVRAIIADNYAGTLENLLKMLNRGRFEAVLAYMPDMGAMATKMEVPVPSYDPAFPVAVYADSLTCRPTGRNQDLLQRINAALAAIKSERNRS